MSTPVESAHLILKLYELRREALLRKARGWFGGSFNPTTYEEFVALVNGPNNVYFRMVTGYWEMTAALVRAGAIDQAMFHATGGELIFNYAKLEPFMAQYRRERGEEHYLENMEAVARSWPGAEARMERTRKYLASMRVAKPKKKAKKR